MNEMREYKEETKWIRTCKTKSW